MLICKELESKVMSAVSAVIPSGTSCTVSGSWQPATTGLIRWAETDTTTPAHISVSVATAKHEVYTTPTASFAAKVTLFVRYDLDATGTILVALSEAMENLFRAWQSSTYQSSFTALDLTAFHVSNVAITGGNSPIIDRDRGLVSVSWPITFNGCYIDDYSSSSSSTTNN